ncbi:angiopoietin-1-like [Drosophila mauritiana]|uniref:Angiopoietin-1-like n=1 Tax=Drosophila mauritiana TaxID=7226 RepID=A0A6P8JGD5_DROMA|nr:angiopoietin-1-like [Drosophila mauritiana]
MTPIAGYTGLVAGTSCVLPDDQEDKCSTICYPTIKPLLKHVGLCHQNNEIVYQLQDKIREQEIEINRFKLENDRLKVQLEEDEKSFELNNQLKEALDNNRNIVSQFSAKLNILINEKNDETIRHLSEENVLLKQTNSELKEIANEKENQLRSYWTQNNGSKEKVDLPSSCLDYDYEKGLRRIKVPGAESFEVLCHSEIAGPGWTLVLRNLGNANFNRNWTEYKYGFGVWGSSFFRGLEVLHLMTRSQPHELYVVANLKDETTLSNHFDEIDVGGEPEGYRLKSIGKPKSKELLFMKSQVNAKFTTYDRNNAGTKTNYAVMNNAGWWYSKKNQLSFTNSPDDVEEILMLIRPKS